MSATKPVGNFEVGKDAIWDEDLEQWFIRVGVKVKKGMVINYTVHGKSPEVAANRAEVLARVMSVIKPDSLSIVEKTIEEILKKDPGLDE